MAAPDDLPDDDDDDAHAPAVDPLIGVVLASRYRIDQKLGRGTTGAVYRASHVKFGRPFAVKVLHAERARDSQLVRRFAREAELGGKVQHPNVISVVDVGEAPDGMRYMVMELAVGIDLATVLQDEAPLAPSRVIHLLRGLCEGLHHAHERGVIHRDLKPENIIIERDDHGGEVPRIVDFGIAIARDEADEPGSPERLTTSGLVLGTPHYMAPEQATGSAMDHRIDLFALGVVAYEMLSGALPFDGNGAQVARANLLSPTPPMSERAPDVPIDPLLEAFTQRLMAKEPAARPPTANAARELLDLIEYDRAAAAALLGLPIEAAEAPPRPRGPQRRAETIPDPVMLARRAARPPPSWLTPAPTRAAVRVEVEPAGETLPMPAPAIAAGAPKLSEAPPVSVLRPDPLVPRADRDSEPIAPARGGGGARIAIAVALLIVVGGVYLATRGPTRAAVAPARGDAAVVVVRRPQVDAAVAAVVAPNAAVVVEPVAEPDAAIATVSVAPRVDAGAPVAPLAPDAAELAPPPPPVDAAAPDAPPPPPPPPPPDASVAPTANAVAALYADVGGDLRRLSDQRGPDVSEALWTRFRRIRLADALATDSARRDAATQLAALRRDIATAAR